MLRSPFTADLDEEAIECLAEAEAELLGAEAGAGLALTSRDWAVVSGSVSAPAVTVSVSAPATVAALLLLGAGLVLSSSEVTVSRPEAVSRVVAASVSASRVATEVTLSTEVVASTGPALLLAGLVLRTSDELVLATASLVAGLLVVT